MNKSKRFLLLPVMLLLLCSMVSPAFSDAAPQIRPGDVVCFGLCDDNCGFDGKWLVLDAEHTNTGEPGMFLVALSLIGDEEGNTLLFRDIGDVEVSFADRGEAFAAAHPGAQDYRGSEIQLWCEAFAQSHLTEAEYAALLPTSKSDAGAVIPGFGIPLPGATTGTVDFDPVTDILAGDRLFLLSAEEVTNTQYGFLDARSRVALHKGTAESYWLRSPHIPTFPLDVGFVFPFGAVMDFPVNGQFAFAMNTYARPACNLDSSKITDAEALAAEGETTIWRLSLGEPNGRNYDTSLPEIGEVMDLNAMFRTALIVIACVLVVIIVLVILLVRHIVRKHRAKKGK